MDFMEMYAQKKMTAEQAASLVKSGDWVDYGWCVNTPVACPNWKTSISAAAS